MVAIQKDAQSTTAEGRTLEQLPWGVSCHEVTTHVDDRGTLVELFNPSWGWHDAPLVYCYCFTLRPGVIKGWAMHKRHEDRYFILSGELELVLYDDRDGSSTRGMVSKLYMSEFSRRLINIPAVASGTQIGTSGPRMLSPLISLRSSMTGPIRTSTVCRRITTSSRIPLNGAGDAR